MEHTLLVSDVFHFSLSDSFWFTFGGTVMNILQSAHLEVHFSFMMMISACLSESSGLAGNI